MSNPQVPLWVPIGVGLLGMIGIIAGQLVNAWRESKKLVREETYRRLAHWRDTRLEIYSQIVELAHDAAENLAASVLADESTKEKLRLYNRGVEKYKQLNKFRSKMLVLADSHVFDRFTEYRDLLLSTQAPCLDYHAGEATREETLESIRLLHKEINRMAMAMREDLGLFN